MTEKRLDPCPELGPESLFKLDDPSLNCQSECEKEPSLKDVNKFFDDIINTKSGLGSDGNCDPMQYGNIINDLSRKPRRDLIYRYSKGLRGCDEAMKDLFTNLVVIDEQGVAHPVPIMWASQERAVAAFLQDHVRKDTSLVVDRVKLPIMSIFSSDFNFNLARHTYHKEVNYFRQNGRPGLTTREKVDNDTVFGLTRGLPIDKGYTLTIWTYFIEDMNQILEQIILKFSPIAYIRVQGIQWEIAVRLDSIASNVDTEPGNTSLRMVKFQINMTAETYVPQPIVRNKAVLKTRIDITDGLNDNEINEIISRLEIAAGES